MDKKGFIGISPMIFFIVLYLGSAIICGDFAKVPLVSAFFITSVYAVAITRGLSLPNRVRVYGRGAGKTKVLFMIWLFIAAGIFASCAEAMGSVQATVDIILHVLPGKFLYIGLFTAGCVLSMATGSGIGSIVALMPIAIEMAQVSGGNYALFSAIVVSSAMFGDNLSFISDTTVIATTSQGCELKDKFRMNLKLVVIPALIVVLLYFRLGSSMGDVPVPEHPEYWKILPYITLLTMAICGVDVLITLLTGIALCAVEGFILGSFNYFEFMTAIGDGILDMGFLVMLILMASGLAALIQHNGGMEWLVKVCTKFVTGRRSAEACIAVLTGLLTLCTSTNTIAIITVGDIVRDLSKKYGVDPRKAASLMDTSSCIVLELIPYSSHILAAAAFTGIATTSIIPYMYYPMLLGIAVIISIIFGRKTVAPGIQ
ncbi:MAG: Na+/H+ antiporter NhaC family protein [Bacteroidales bacterium]|nr:Na+/H+ antiporter NhaC family protein [Candidatus Cacconaster scatequi]